ncbi:MAG: class I SAM-dependent methyltransferase [Myxococcota bacterium]
MAKRTRTRKGRRRSPAPPLDRHALYERAVQEPDAEIDIVTSIFKKRTGRVPLSMREDFAGTANLCAAWVRSHPDRTATGIDLDRETLEWGRWHNLAPLGEDAWRITLRCQDVREKVPGRFDVALAFNYSYQVFKKREDLRSYFAEVRKTLERDGMLFLDLMGGWEARMPLEEERREDGFWYTWDQDFYNPINSNLICHIHFRLDDGTEMRRAFTYDWRLWQPVELTELLLEAGFARADVYWEDEDEDRNDTGHFRIRKKVQNDPGWNCYIVAQNER